MWKGRNRMLTQNLPTWDIRDFEPHISVETMFVHVHKLHKGYVDKLNKRFGNSGLLSLDPSDVLRDLDGYLEDSDKEFYRNMMGGNVTHTLLWKCITPNPNPRYQSQLLNDFGMSKSDIISKIKSEGLSRFGSGWVWGCIDPFRKTLKIYSTKNHDTPYMRKYVPLFCIDVWEHAYFLDDYGDRAKWLDAICEFIDWQAIDSIYNTFLDGQDPIDAWVLG